MMKRKQGVSLSVSMTFTTFSDTLRSHMNSLLYAICFYHHVP